MPLKSQTALRPNAGVYKTYFSVWMAGRCELELWLAENKTHFTFSAFSASLASVRLMDSTRCPHQCAWVLKQSAEAEWQGKGGEGAQTPQQMRAVMHRTFNAQWLASHPQLKCLKGASAVAQGFCAYQPTMIFAGPSRVCSAVWACEPRPGAKTTLNSRLIATHIKSPTNRVPEVTVMNSGFFQLFRFSPHQPKVVCMGHFECMLSHLLYTRTNLSSPTGWDTSLHTRWPTCVRKESDTGSFIHQKESQYSSSVVVLVQKVNNTKIKLMFK